MEDVLVSVVIPTYKRPFDILKRAINSVLNQTYSNMEIIVVDDSPMEYIEREVVKSKLKCEYGENVRYIQHDENRGACAARNTGIKNSRGSFIAFLDDDDEWYKNKIKMQLEKFSDNEVGLVYCDSVSVFTKNGKIIKEKIRAYDKEGWVFDELIKSNFIGSTSFVMIRKNVFEDVGNFDLSMKSAQDAEMWLRISKQFKVKHIPKVLVRYYIHEGDRITGNIDNKIQGLEQLNTIYKEYLKENKKIYSIRKLKIIPYYKKKYGFMKALEKWIEAIKIYPFHFEVISSIKNLL